MKLKVEDITEILEALPENGETILVGGQALNIWAEYYATKDSEIKELEQCFFSGDIDFIGTRNTANQVNSKLQGTIRVPDMDTHTTMTAKITRKTKEGLKMNVDFLQFIVGVEDKELKKNTARIKDPETGKEIRVLHPGHCLASRIPQHLWNT